MSPSILDKTASSSRHCDFYLASNGKWYMELGDFEHAEAEDSTTYGPFPSLKAAEEYVKNFSNPGGSYEDDSGQRRPPTQSPNGQPVKTPSSGSSSRGYPYGRRATESNSPEFDKTASAKRIIEAFSKASAEPPMHLAVKTDEALGQSYRDLVSLKLGFDSWGEIPSSAQPLYRYIGEAISKIVDARRATTQVREMIRLKRY